MKIIKFIKQLFCFHPRLRCKEYNDFGFGGDIRIYYRSPWDLFAVIETRYICNKCGGLFWYTKGDFEEEKMNEIFLRDIQSGNYQTKQQS